MISKKELKEYLTNRFDVTYKELYKEFGIDSKEGRDKLEQFLKELIKEKWIKKSWCVTCKQYEFDPSDKQYEQGVI